MAQVISTDPAMAIDGVKQLEKIIASTPDAALAHVNEIVPALTLQIRLAFTASDVTSAGVSRLCKHLINVLVQIFSVPELARALKREQLDTCINELLHWFMDPVLGQFDQGSQLVRQLQEHLLVAETNAESSAHRMEWQIRKLREDLQDVQLKLDAENAKARDLSDALEVQKQEADQALKELEAANLARIIAEKGESVLKIQVNELEQSLTQVTNIQRLAEERIRTLEEEEDGEYDILELTYMLVELKKMREKKIVLKQFETELRDGDDTWADICRGLKEKINTSQTRIEEIRIQNPELWTHVDAAGAAASYNTHGPAEDGSPDDAARKYAGAIKLIQSLRRDNAQYQGRLEGEVEEKERFRVETERTQTLLDQALANLEKERKKTFEFEKQRADITQDKGMAEESQAGRLGKLEEAVGDLKGQVGELSGEMRGVKDAIGELKELLLGMVEGKDGTKVKDRNESSEVEVQEIEGKKGTKRKDRHEGSIVDGEGGEEGGGEDGQRVKKTVKWFE
ncbi:hypothetical protein HK097_007507 [Rhizophlyctis rosea]|uniref:Uncharacterized protein n=1 Tax=Rhizophlyctis rosea TaxID=64517 RepID=A0AAD5SJH5_9FUNG|nr:hypothetical protein HK097_007507 [Rhizophlyctis rosea]